MEPLSQFTEIVARPSFRLGEAFCAFARNEYPDLDVAACLERLDTLGRQAADAMHGAGDPVERLSALSAHLHETGFRGNDTDYYDPRNSFLNEVLDTRVGIPISLAVVWIEAGRAAGLPVTGIGLPMHFLVGLEGHPVYADPFRPGGPLLDEQAVIMLFGRLTEGRAEWHDDYLRASPHLEIVRRALTNLKGAYGGRGDMHRLLWVCEHLLAIPGSSPAEHRVKARALSALGSFRKAIAELETYLQTDPDDADEASSEIRSLKATMN